eukprot:TRINITY_DN14058_c0_g1_i3.p1 TRINITY_DN14058_c0_g1~~TRINITY_DN14058_c0_g1_i3.p1  ORF type:complete len:124 (-),score=19.09 TRINITY_DN14058_c0_g1_i3:39-410(-)
MIRRPPRSTLSSSSAASDVYKRQAQQSRLCGRPSFSSVGEQLSQSSTEVATSVRKNFGVLRVISEAKLAEQGQIFFHGPRCAQVSTQPEPCGCWQLPVLCVDCLLYTSPSPRDRTRSRMPSSA